MKTGFATDQTLLSAKSSTLNVDPVPVKGSHFLETQVNDLEFVSDGRDTKTVVEGAAHKKANAAASLFAGVDLLSELGAPTEKEAKDVALTKKMTNAGKGENVGADILGELAAPDGGRTARDAKAQTRIG